MTTTRVIVRLPYNRPEQTVPDPTPVVWSLEKENYLWESIAKLRAGDTGVPDWKALARRLDVPLPYLLYRAQTRYEQDLRGLQDVRGAFSPPTPQAKPRTSDFIDAAERTALPKATSVARLHTPLGVRARLNSLGSNSAARVPKASSSSVLTLRDGYRKESSHRRPVSPLSSESDSESEEAVRTEKAEQQEELDRKLAHLQKTMTGDALGLVSSVRSRPKQVLARGRLTSSLPHPAALELQARQDSSQSISSASSPRGSIPDIPSPPPEAQSPQQQRFSPSAKNQRLPSQTASPTLRQQPLLRYGGLMKAAAARASERGSNYGSSTSKYRTRELGLPLIISLKGFAKHGWYMDRVLRVPDYAAVRGMNTSFKQEPVSRSLTESVPFGAEAQWRMV
ncbi:hypothetical protein K488DRAFT_77461 [Vararia minispora EC-137]|uniref:Uncharacterized protein n=1 Tax=Vararia minispora EC-137 TaxID=1314806 RepID=A0ACB8QRU0_9AGAM|nr:hypothetical protein K488DRAFT_77461 [Vararia minispora EC-137]